ncbi:MAG TPA: FHA domain-containing protein [Longimicrobiales bacterium]|nr:FHA domain-containing protein [Longimicrobiales bacterium]
MTKTPNAGIPAFRSGTPGRARCAAGAWRCLSIGLLLLALTVPAAAQQHRGGDAADDDRDGVPNLLDRCLYTGAGARVDDVGCPLKQDERDDARTILIAAGALLVLLTLGGVLWVRRARREAAPEEHVPLILFAPQPGHAPLPAPPPRTAAPPERANAPPPAGRAGPPGAVPPPFAPAAPPAAAPSLPVPSAPPPAAAPGWPEPAAPGIGSFGEPPTPRPGNGGGIVSGASAADSTLRLLPGRLEVLAGAGDREIRFVQGSAAVTEITVGRQTGPATRHLQLPAPTVSRLHARLRYESGSWSIANLSRTNPVVVNGAPMSDVTAEHRLCEGDRIEVGEYIFIFHER